MSEIITLIGDPHAKNSNLDLIHELCSIVEDLGNTTVWLGDLLDTKEVIRGKSLNTWIDYFKSSKLQHHVLVGNHDWFNLDCKEHALESLKLLPNVHVVDSPQFTPGGLGFLPYMHDEAALVTAISNMKDAYVKTLIGHLELKSFDFGTGLICKSGLAKTDLNHFDLVVSGHFHKYQRKDNIVYLGTPFSHSFGEANQTKYIAELDTETRKIKLIDTPFRRHISWEVECDTQNQLDLQILNNIFRDFTDPKKHLYRLILTGKKENIDKFRREIFKDLSVKWITRPSDFSLNNVKIDDATSNEKQFEKWATEIQDMDAETLKLGLEIMGVVK